MNKSCFLLAWFVLSFCACSNDYDSDLSAGIVAVETIDSQNLNAKMLHFSSEIEFNNAVKSLDSISYDKRIEWVNVNFGKFNSLKDVYDRAMNDAAELDESRMAFEEFRQKYERYLFFADYRDDCGIYLPTSRESVAYLVNANGDVVINGQIRNMKDIFCYTQLQQLGIAMYDENEKYSTRSRDEVEEEYSSGWYHENGKKIRLKCGRQVLMDSGILTTPVSMRMHIEISFRKKTWLGWTNYSSHVDLSGNYTIAGITAPVNESKTADSSHDYYYALPDASPVPYYNGYMRKALAISANFTIGYRGIPHDLNYQFELSEAYL